MNAKRLSGALVLLLLLCTALVPAVSAHRAFVGEIMEDEVRLKAWYEGGDPMNEASVKVYAIEDGKEELYLEGLTDEEGVYSFEPKDEAAEYRVIVEQLGHRAKTKIDLEGPSSQEEAELPLYARIIAGFGYLLGLAGAGMIYSARKIEKDSRKNR